MFKNIFAKFTKFFKLKKKKIFYFLFGFGSISLISIGVATFFIHKTNNLLINNQFQKVKSESTIAYIKVDLPKDEVITMTDLEPKASFHIINYEDLINVSIKASDPKLIRIIDKKNGTIGLEVLKRGFGYITISAANAPNDYVIKFVNGLFKNEYIIYQSDNCLITNRGIITISYDKSHNLQFKLVSQSIWETPKMSDILASSKNIVATKYGIYDSLDNQFVLKSIYSKMTKDDIVDISDSIIVTKKGIFCFNGLQIAKNIYPTISKSEINGLYERIIVTPRGIFTINNRDKPYVLENAFGREDVLACSYSNARGINYFLTNYKIYDENFSPIVTIFEATGHLNTWIDDFLYFTANFVITKDAIYNYNTKSLLKYLGDQTNSIILVTNDIVVTSDGFYNSDSTSEYKPNWFDKPISKEDILYSSDHVIYTTKGIIDGYDFESSYKHELEKSDIYAVNKLDGTAIIKNYDTYTYSIYTFIDKFGNFVKLNGKNLVLHKNEIIKNNSQYIITPNICYEWDKSLKVTNQLNYLDNLWHYNPSPMPPSDKSNKEKKNSTNTIIGLLVGIGLFLVCVSLLVWWSILKHNKKIERNLNYFNKAVSNLLKKMNETRPKKISLLTSKNNQIKQMQPKRILAPKPPIFKSIDSPKNNQI